MLNSFREKTTLMLIDVNLVMGVKQRGVPVGEVRAGPGLGTGGLESPLGVGRCLVLNKGTF